MYSAEAPFLPQSSRFEELRNKDFDGLSKTKPELRDHLLYIYHEHITGFNLDIVKFQRFLFAVSENYQDNAFHNFSHAFTVTQMLYSIDQRTTRLADLVGTTERFALLLSALGHDLNHPGVTNAFLVNSRHNLAVRYNDNSVLENHHAATLIAFLELQGCDFIIALSPEQWRALRKMIIPMILATDMTKHFSLMEKFSGIAASYNKEKPEHRQLTIEILLHAADVGNPALKFELATEWSLRIIKEFNLQVAEEERRGLPVSEFLRVGNDLEVIKQHQIGFISNFILPLWELISNAVPGLEEFIEAIRENKKNWEALENIKGVKL